MSRSWLSWMRQMPEAAKPMAMLGLIELIALASASRNSSPSSSSASADKFAEILHVEIGDRRRKKRQDLRYNKSADHCDAEGLSRSAPAPMPIAIGSAPRMAAIVVIMIRRKRNTAACKDFRLLGGFMFDPQALQREIDHHDRVLFDDAD